MAAMLLRRSLLFSRRIDILARKRCQTVFITSQGSYDMPKRFSSTKEAVKIDKSLLVKLRKNTGFSFAKCREALERSNNDISQAEAWLHEQAEKEGWSKATKLQGRTATEGLVSVLVENHMAAMVEMNCETDFVARNENFVDLVTMVTQSALDHRKAVVKQNHQVNMFGNTLTHLREVLLTHDLQNLATPKGTVDELVAMTIGKLGENIKLRRAITMTTEETNIIGSYVHGSLTKPCNGLSLGKFGAIVVVKPLKENIDGEKLSTLCRDLAKHVVGMNPKVILSSELKDGTSDDKDNSIVLVEQNYLMDSSKTVGELLDVEGIKVVDFVRYQCGEN